MTMGTAEEITTLREAAKLVNRSPETVRAWCNKYGLGQLDGRRFRINKTKLLSVAKAHDEADALLSGL